MEVITNSAATPEWNSLAPLYPRFNALFPAVSNPVPSTLNYKPTLVGSNSSETTGPSNSKAHPGGWDYNRVSTVIKYINSLSNLQQCNWTNDITFANVMCLDCAKYIAQNPAKFSQLRTVILSGHDICCDKDLVVPTGLSRLPALTMLGLEYGRTCEIQEPFANILEIHFNELSNSLAQEVSAGLDGREWITQWFPNCQTTVWH